MKQCKYCHSEVEEDFVQDEQSCPMCGMVLSFMLGQVAEQLNLVCDHISYEEDEDEEAD